ncbi:hypothetical protein VXE65_32665 [Mycolicibacterium conceptionense]|uniref:hypothetical protein n=1 Tax=Mycolicibacterium conceptionense TaxID=451644 RepID=UPI003204DDB6
METPVRRSGPTDYPTRAKFYREQAATYRAAGDEQTARTCDDFAERCEQRGQSLTAVTGNFGGPEASKGNRTNRHGDTDHS